MVRTAVVAALGLLSACNQASNSDELANAEKRIDALEKKISDLEIDKIFSDGEKVAWLEPSEKGYSFAKTDIGSLTFSMEKVEPYADGTRLTLKIGNPTSARITELTAKIAWGKRDENQTTTELGSKKITLDNIGPASWTVKTVDVPAVPPTQFGYLSIQDISAQKIFLY